MWGLRDSRDLEFLNNCEDSDTAGDIEDRDEEDRDEDWNKDWGDSIKDNEDKDGEGVEGGNIE